MGYDKRRDHEHVNHLMSYELIRLAYVSRSDPGVGVLPHRHLLYVLEVEGWKDYKWGQNKCSQESIIIHGVK